MLYRFWKTKGKWIYFHICCAQDFSSLKNNFYTPGSTHSNNKTDLQSWVGGPRGWKWDTEICIATWPSIDWYYLRLVTICWLFGGLCAMSLVPVNRCPCYQTTSTVSTSVESVNWEDRQAQKPNCFLQALSSGQDLSTLLGAAVGINFPELCGLG